jgi:DNA-directed RNA polymerase specialized sigma24 family protein
VGQVIAMNVNSNVVSASKGSTEDACDRDAAYRESIARLYREHNQALLKFLRLRADSDQEAQEVPQEACARMLQLESTRAVSFLSS